MFSSRTYLTQSKVKQTIKRASHGVDTLLARTSKWGYFRILDPQGKQNMALFDAILITPNDVKQAKSQKACFDNFWNYIVNCHLDKDTYPNKRSYLVKNWVLESQEFYEYEAHTGSSVIKNDFVLVPANGYINNDCRLEGLHKLRVSKNRVYCISKAKGLPDNFRAVHISYQRP